MRRKTNNAGTLFELKDKLWRLIDCHPEASGILSRAQDAINGLHAWQVSLAIEDGLWKVQEIVDKTRLPRPKVQKVLDMYVARGILEAGIESSPGERGRPTKIYQPCIPFGNYRDEEAA